MNEFEMAAFVDQRLNPADRDRVAAHLDGCPDCRHELLEIHGLRRRQRRGRPVVLAASLVAAAALLALFVRPTAPDPERDVPAASALIAYGPTGDARLGSLRFVWGATPGVATYHLTVSGADGAPVWSGSVADTVLTLPDSVALRADRRYFWVADALLEDGSTRSTGLHEFRPMR